VPSVDLSADHVVRCLPDPSLAFLPCTYGQDQQGDSCHSRLAVDPMVMEFMTSATLWPDRLSLAATPSLHNDSHPDSLPYIPVSQYWVS
jgi:hypothetical protein